MTSDAPLDETNTAEAVENERKTNIWQNSEDAMKGRDFLKSNWCTQASAPRAEEQVLAAYPRWVARVKNHGLVERAGQICSYLTSGQSSGTDKLLMVAALLYLISPVDLVPDYLPVIGWLDDLGVATFVLSYVSRRVDDDSTLDTAIEGTELVGRASAH